MAQTKPEFSELEDFATIAQQLVDKYPEIYGGIDLSTVKCVCITNKECPDKKRDQPYEVKAVPQPIRMDCPFSYYVIVYQDDWVERSEALKAMLTAAILMAIPTDKDKEGKTNTCDLKDWSTLLRTFGVDYLVDDKVPNILTDKVDWKLR